MRSIVGTTKAFLFVGGAALGFAVIGGIAIKVYGTENMLGDLVIQLLATFIAALLALAVGLYLLTRQADNRRKELRKLLKAELEETSKYIVDQQATWSGPAQTGLVYVQPLVIEEAARSGLFPEPFARELLSIARGFHTYNIKVSRMLLILSMNPYEDQELRKAVIDPAREGLAQQAHEVKSRCDALLRDVNLIT